MAMSCTACGKFRGLEVDDEDNLEASSGREVRSYRKSPDLTLLGLARVTGLSSAML